MDISIEICPCKAVHGLEFPVTVLSGQRADRPPYP